MGDVHAILLEPHPEHSGLVATSARFYSKPPTSQAWINGKGRASRLSLVLWCDDEIEPLGVARLAHYYKWEPYDMCRAWVEEIAGGTGDESAIDDLGRIIRVDPDWNEVEPIRTDSEASRSARECGCCGAPEGTPCDDDCDSRDGAERCL